MTRDSSQLEERGEWGHKRWNASVLPGTCSFTEREEISSDFHKGQYLFANRQTSFEFVLGSEQHPTRCCSRAHGCFCSLGCLQRHHATMAGENWSCPRGILCQEHGNFQETSEQLQGSLKTDCDVNVNPCDSSCGTSSNYLGRRKIFLWTYSFFALTLI